MSDVIPANYELWRKADIWTIQRGILLLLNREMFPANNEQNMPVLNKFLDILIIAESSLKIGKLPIFHRPEYHEENSEGVLEFEVLPSDFIKWAVSKGYEIPPQLEIKNPVTATKPVTPILDIFNELYADSTSQRKEYQEKRLETISKYGSEWLTLQDFINRVLLNNWGESSTLSAFCLLVDNGLIVYDNESPERPVSYAGLIASLKDREAHCSIDADNLEFWDTLKNEKNYQVHIDNVARAHYLKGDKTFDWYNWFSDNVIQLTIPDVIKADIEQSIVVNIQDNIKENNEQVLTPSINNNDFEFSGWLNIPKKVDDWVRAIDDMVREFHKQNGKRPNEVQAWGQLWTSPPVGYSITTNTDKGKEDCLNMPSVSPLSKSAFIKRWKKYTNNAQ
jgi:hypothetical protein